jgi:hypothetical protein
LGRVNDLRIVIRPLLQVFGIILKFSEFAREYSTEVTA